MSFFFPISSSKLGLVFPVPQDHSKQLPAEVKKISVANIAKSSFFE